MFRRKVLAGALQAFSPGRTQSMGRLMKYPAFDGSPMGNFDPKMGIPQARWMVVWVIRIWDYMDYMSNIWDL